MSETGRRDLQRRLFPEGVPRLWCPPLTHYDRDGGIDHVRCAAHLAFIARWSRGWLAPGSTGDAWELTAQETQEVVDLALLEAARLGAKVLVGALHPDAAEAARVVRDTSARVGAGWGAGSRTGSVGSAGSGTSDRFSADQFDGALCGFAACPPRGDDLTQEEIGSALGELLSLGAPLALYQLPQVTENEMSPDLVASLARRFPNFVLFKDTSGADRVTVAQAAGLDLEGVFLVRGAEGGYAAHLRPNGGGYDGLLLSTANSFGAQLSSIIDLSLDGRSGRGRRALVAPLGARGRAVRGRGPSLRRQPLRQRGQSRRPLLRLRSPGPCRTAAAPARGLGAAPRSAGGHVGGSPPVRSAADAWVPRVGSVGLAAIGWPQRHRWTAPLGPPRKRRAASPRLPRCASAQV